MDRTGQDNLPQVAVDYIDSVIKAMKYRKKVRAEVRAELIDHFIDVLADCETEDEKQQAVEELIAEFGDEKLLGKLMRRAKKRCRPLWQQTMLAVLKVIGIIFLLLLLRVGYMATGRPTISVDYTQWMNDKVRDGRDESLNARHDYQKAVGLILKMPPEIEKINSYPRGQEKTEEDWIAIEAFLETEAPAIEAFRQGATKPYYWNTYKATKEYKKYMDFPADVLEKVMPQMSGYKKIATQIGYFLVPFEIHQGNIQQAVDDSISLCVYGQHLLSQGVAIEQLVGVAIESLAMSVVYDLLDQVELSADDLLRLQQIIEKDYDPDKAPMDWSLEKAFWYDQIQRSFTDDGTGNGRPLPRGTILVVSDMEDYVKGFLVGFPDRKEATLQINNWFEQFDNYRNKKPLVLNSYDERKIDEQAFLLIKSSLMQNVAIPAMKKTIEISWRVRAGQAGLIGTLSVLRFEKENGRLPEDWNELFEKEYLKTIPLDPYSDKPLVYRRTDDGFILYSVGFNFTDDGGMPGSDKNGKYRRWGEQGDWIFWPVETLD